MIVMVSRVVHTSEAFELFTRYAFDVVRLVETMVIVFHCELAALVILLTISLTRAGCLT